MERDDQSRNWDGVPEVRRRIMQANRRRDTSCELAIRSELHRRGKRFRVDVPIRVGKARPVRADVVFPKQQLAIFVDGCFWHGCPEHGSMPATNKRYWSRKLAENRQRDDRNRQLLESGGWNVLRFWEHESPIDVADHVSRVLEELGGNPA